MTIKYEDLVNHIKGFAESRIDIKMEDYLGSTIRIWSYDDGAMVSIKKADYTDYTGWRGLQNGTLQEMESELLRLCTFPGEISEIFTNNEDDNGEET